MDSARFAEEQLKLLLDIGRVGGCGATFQERMGAVAPLVQRLIPGRVTASVHDPDAPDKLASEPAWFFGPGAGAVRPYAEYMKVDPMRPVYAEAAGRPAVLSDTEGGRRNGQAPLAAGLPGTPGSRHRMLCVHRMPDGAVFAFALHRGPDQQDFDARERALLALCAPDLARAATGLVLQRMLQANAIAPGSASGVHGVAFDRDGRVVHADLGSSLLLDGAALRRLGEEVAARALAPTLPPAGTAVQLSLQMNGGPPLPVRLLALDAQSGLSALALLSHEAADSRFERLAREARLTARERQVAALAIDGLRNRDIAERLGVGVDTVKWHLKTIFLKTKVRGRGGLAAIVLGRG